MVLHSTFDDLVQKTYEWLFSHTLLDPGRPVNREVMITQNDLNQAYREMEKRGEQLEVE